MNWLLTFLRYVTIVHIYAQKAWNWFWGPNRSDVPVRRYFLSDEDEFDESYTRVPEDAVYVEEWVENDQKRCVVRYEGEEIPHAWVLTPFDMKDRKSTRLNSSHLQT
jgi:hypothetical protein